MQHLSAEKPTETVECDILVVGGGAGGTAAALCAGRSGRAVCLVEPTQWLGGQLTSQGVSALDEHRYIESFGGTASYYELREGIREYYRTQSRLTEAARRARSFNPGNGWVSRLCFEPRAAVATIDRMLAPEVEAGRLRVFKETEPVGVDVNGDRIQAVTVEHVPSGRRTRIAATYVIDATELGDLLPLAGCAYVSGAEPASETGEPHAHPGEGNPEMVQSFTFPFAVEWRPGEDHTIDKPEGYEAMRDAQPYTFAIDYGPKMGVLTYKMFEQAPGTPGSFWTYRRLIDAGNFSDPRHPDDVSMINWPGNDFTDGNIIDKPASEREAILERARRLSLGFLYWLQTEAPRDDGGRGYPELLLRKDVMGTADGLSMFPYIRESRRIKALKTIVEQEISAAFQSGARAAYYADSVGVSWYPIDIHACSKSAGEDPPHIDGGATRPFQIPLGALIPVRVENLLAGGKNIGTTHITNGSYRLHPAEWNIGEAAGALASYALETGALPRRIRGDPVLLRAFQSKLVDAGVPLYWFVDVGVDHPAFRAVQWLAATGVIQGDHERLHFDPEEPCPDATRERWLMRAVECLTGRREGAGDPAFLDAFMRRDMTRGAFANELYDALMLRFVPGGL